ncbi:hypothetical protein [uncultured Clostridium sp.]|nr:hypothetical protein [uncultured Clostridium sp.]
MDPFILDKLVLNTVKNLKNITGYNMFMYSLFLWGIVQSIFKEDKK